MGCTIEKLAGGGSAIICGPRGTNRRKCAYCPRRHTKLCDFVVGHEKTVASGTSISITCDKLLCDACAVPIAPNKDHCRLHKEQGHVEAKL